MRWRPLELRIDDTDDRRRIDAAGQTRPDRDVGLHMSVEAHAKRWRGSAGRLRSLPSKSAGGGTNDSAGGRTRASGGPSTSTSAGHPCGTWKTPSKRVSSVVVRIPQARKSYARCPFGWGRARKRGELLDLRRKGDEALRRDPVVQRLDAEPIAGRKDGTRAGVVEEECEHSLQALETGLAPLRVGGEDHLGIGVRREQMTSLLEPPAQFSVVVDLPVEYDPQAPIGGAHGLVPGRREIDDRETAMAQDERGRRRV